MTDIVDGSRKADILSKLGGIKSMGDTGLGVLNKIQPQAKLDKVLIILLDSSGSMQEHMENFKEKIVVAWNVMCDELMPNMGGWAFGVLHFGMDVEWLMRPTTHGDLFDVQRPRAYGGTSMGIGLKEAWGTIKTAAKSSRFILLSDGRPTDMGAQEILEMAASHTDIPIDTIGVGAINEYSYDPQFLKELSRITGGVFSDVSTAQNLASTIKKLSPVERPLLGEVKK